ncbi:MAG: hypothetical protein EBS53_13090 [Bacteroidetes bacterium]|nr:hypothetical protein [Bacteroidota bacterium]
MKHIVFLGALLLQGCSYRYGTGYFSLNDPPPNGASAAYPSTTVEKPYATSTDAAGTVQPEQPPPCDEHEEKLVVTNKLDSKNQTIETTAVSKRSTNPCQK